MSITSFAWVEWLCAFVLVFWIAPDRWRDLVVSGVTLTFLLVNDPTSALILVLFIGGTYALCGRGRPSGARTALICGLLVTTLAFYKLRLVTGRADWLGGIAIPIGLSYYAFRCLHYALERYKGTLRPHSLRDFAAYLLFLPTLLAGPIHRFPGFQRDLARCRWNAGLFAEGLERILYGYVKIMLIGVFLLSEVAADRIDRIPSDSEALVAYLSMVRRSLYGYFLFAGYSDVAIGLSRLVGIRVMENFDWPFIRRNISQFWQSWHISLSTFIREYAYAPIFAITRSAPLAAIISMVLFGLWHELSPRYVLWGAYHGAGIAVWQGFQRLKRRFAPVRSPLVRTLLDGASTLLTFHFVVLGFVLTLEPTVADAMRVYTLLLTGW